MKFAYKVSEKLLARAVSTLTTSISVQQSAGNRFPERKLGFQPRWKFSDQSSRESSYNLRSEEVSRSNLFIVITCHSYFIQISSNKSQTLPIQSRYNITALDLSPNGSLLVASNENGETYMVSMLSQTVIHTYSFHREPKCIKFSPCGRFFAILVEQMSE
jgi:WD40 repeat protein